MSFSHRQKILKCLWSKIFELQKFSRGHTEKSWAKFVNHFDVLDNLSSRKNRSVTAAGTLNGELLETSYNELEIYQD